jgi:sulfur relay (sulfurtransferase) DsrF/TusC family protein
MQYKSYVNKHSIAKLKLTQKALIFNSEPIDLADLQLIEMYGAGHKA